MSKFGFTLSCEECGLRTSVVMSTPIGVSAMSERAWEAHRKHEVRRHCQCPGHYLQIDGVSISAPSATVAAGKAEKT